MTKQRFEDIAQDWGDVTEIRFTPDGKCTILLSDPYSWSQIVTEQPLEVK